ncbi:preprotein translocase subunit SecG [Sphingomonas canadensis]|uniref:Protein-export membrane protein SecG n=1 Tax=Sphingomonas canadensis TaxID=1219257 RepID=A0ABW3H905_9SPHN|nr:preprotein translocase subunit SecG [Sphingomonas canadensis]MCW3836681.1 preprotein translocase subunit SecG [Sphingomonas canadensis]
MLFTFLLVVQFIVAALLVTVILMQRSEGGGLTTGGSPSGLMSARGAADFLTRATSILATAFVALCILLAVLAANRQSGRIDASLQKAPEAAAPAANVTAPAQIPGIPADNASSAIPGIVTGNSAIPTGN